MSVREILALWGFRSGDGVIPTLATLGTEVFLALHVHAHVGFWRKMHRTCFTRMQMLNALLQFRHAVFVSLKRRGRDLGLGVGLTKGYRIKQTAQFL